MVKIGKKRTYQQMSAEEHSSKDEKVEGVKEEDSDNLKKKRGLEGKIIPVEQRLTEVE